METHMIKSQQVDLVNELAKLIRDKLQLKANINTENYTKTIDCVPPLVRWHFL